MFISVCGPRTLFLFLIKIMEENTKDSRVYELAFLLVPTFTEELALSKFGDMKGILESNGATFIAEDMPKMLELAYEMSRIIENKKTWFGSAYFGWIKFEVEADKVHAVEEVLKRDETIIRFMTIKTVKESTIASRKPYSRPMRTNREKTGEEAVVVDQSTLAPKEELDNQIDALVTE